MTTRFNRWNPIREMMAMQNAMDRIFDETWRNVQTNFDNNAMLALDVHETDDAYTVVTALPGLTTDDIDIRLHNGTLTISGEFKEPQVNEGTRVLINERVYGRFSRSLQLPQDIDADNVEANFENGILALTLPKTPESQPRQIPVRASGLLQGGN